MIPTPLNCGCTVQACVEMRGDVQLDWAWSQVQMQHCPCPFCQSWGGTPWSQCALLHTHIAARQRKNHWHGSLDSLILPFISWQNISFTWRARPGDSRRQFHKFDRCCCVRRLWVFCKKISDSELKVLMKTYKVNILMCQCVSSLFESKHFFCLIA